MSETNALPAPDLDAVVAGALEDTADFICDHEEAFRRIAEAIEKAMAPPTDAWHGFAAKRIADYSVRRGQIQTLGVQAAYIAVGLMAGQDEKLTRFFDQFLAEEREVDR